jgi:beta-lactamase superfamily II metal-dependent hydrolase
MSFFVAAAVAESDQRQSAPVVQSPALWKPAWIRDTDGTAMRSGPLLARGWRSFAEVIASRKLGLGSFVVGPQSSPIVANMNQELEVIFLDVGQGDSTLIRLPNGEHMLVDVYRCPGHGTVDLFKVLRDHLPSGGHRQTLDYLVITHAHDDHIWGIGDLADEFEIGELWVPQYGTKTKLSENYDAFVKVVENQPEDRKVWQKGSRSPVADLADGAVSVRCFSPPGYIEVAEELEEDDARRVVHENCGVYRLTSSGVSVMLTGDSNLPAWERIVAYYADRNDENDLSVLDSDVLHASHHGSRTFVKDDKDDDPWLEAFDAIDPECIVISVGENNRHDHPHEDMVEIYATRVGAENVLETRDEGTLVMTVTGEASFGVEADDSYAERYGWDEGGGSGSKGYGPSGSGSGRSRRPPTTPPPGYEKTPQRAPRRERYAG